MTSLDIDRRAFVGLGAAGLVGAALPAAGAATQARTVAFADSTVVPALGQGSWHMASGKASPVEAVDAMRLGVSIGMTLLDTSDDYSDGEAEKLVAKVIAGQREKIFLVSKLSPSEATTDGVLRALDASLKRLGTDHLDLYLLHFRERADLAAAVKGFEAARERGLTKRWGVSNFAVADMEELFAVPNGDRCATNQVLYNVAARGIETDLMPWCAKRRMPIMAYSPLGSGGTGRLLANPALKQVADALGVTPAAVALAWAMRDGRTIAVTETGSSKHVRENAAAETLALQPSDLAALDAAFPPPRAG